MLACAIIGRCSLPSFLVSWDRVSFCVALARSVDQAGLELSDPLASASQVLGLKVWVTREPSFLSYLWAFTVGKGSPTPPLTSFSFYFDVLSLYFVYICALSTYVCMYVCIPLMCLMPVKVRGWACSPWNWSYRCVSHHVGPGNGIHVFCKSS
jgi:hypothetical protein